MAVLGSGVIATRADQSLETRLGEIHDGVLEVIDAYEPRLLVVEDLYAEYKFPRTALQMAHARGVIYLAAQRRGVAVLALAPSEVKRAVTGNGAAAKEQMQHSMRRLLKLPDVPSPSHVADALALAFTGLSRWRTQGITTVAGRARDVRLGAARP
jgi:crossover junction endodeoxyribonuclease RuvC